MNIPELLAKAAIGGIMVVLFAILGETLQPRSLGGITSGAPSIAVAGLLIALLVSGAAAAVDLALGMTVGAVGLVAWCVVGAPAVRRFGALRGSLAATLAWFAVALSLWLAVLR